MSTLPLSSPKSKPECPPDFLRVFPDAVRVDCEGYSVWVATAFEGRGPRARCTVEAISEPVLTDAVDFECNYGVEPTLANLARVADRESDRIETAALNEARTTWMEGFRP